MAKDKTVVHLNIFLVKEAFTRRDQIIDHDVCKDPTEIPISGSGKGYLYFKSTQSEFPKWSSLFAAVMDIKRIGKVSNVSAAFLLKVEGRYFVLTFGQGGRFLLRDDVCEDRFGLLVALNSVKKESFRCVDKQSLDTIQSHTRIQSGQETTADQFGLDVEQDMLKAIVGTPTDSLLGNRMTGTDSLSVSVQMELSDLPFLLKAYKEQFEKDLSTTDYQWVNNISIVKSSSSLIAELEKELIGRFEKKDFANLWLAIPEIIQWDLVKGFIYSNGKRVLHTDINMDGFLTTIDTGLPISLEMLKQHRVFCADADHNKVFKSWPIYKCLYAEIDYERNKYLLNDGKWFNVSVDFVERTNVDFKKIETSALTLPEYSGGGEGEYNKFVANKYPERFALLDDKKKIFHGGGHGQVEVCDLLSFDKQLVHVKIYGKSTVFSHLFSQGFVSGQLLQVDAEFRKKVKDKLSPPFHNLIKVDTRPAEKEFTVIFAVISDSPGRTLYLPFFSRVNLNNTAKTLKGFGYNVELLKIPVNPVYAITKKCPPGKKGKQA